MTIRNFEDYLPALPSLLTEPFSGRIAALLPERPDLPHHPLLDAAGLFGATVVSVGRRLAPEYPYTAPIDDLYTGLLWIDRATSGTARHVQRRISRAAREARHTWPGRLPATG